MSPILNATLALLLNTTTTRVMDEKESAFIEYYDDGNGTFVIVDSGTDVAEEKGPVPALGPYEVPWFTYIVEGILLTAVSLIGG